MATTIGFLGAGQLGEPVVTRLLGAGHDVLVYAPRDETRHRLMAFGAAVVDSVRDPARRSDVLISCLFSDAQLRETGLGPDGFVANAQLIGAAAQLGSQLGVGPDILLSTLQLCSAGSNASAHAHRLGGMDRFAELAGPFLRKDVTACREAAAASGVDLGLQGATVRRRPLPLDDLVEMVQGSDGYRPWPMPAKRESPLRS